MLESRNQTVINARIRYIPIIESNESTAIS